MATLGLIVPAYRPDGDRLAAYLERLDDRLAPTHLRVELDAPDAETVATLRDGPATVATSDSRRGKGAAITAGFEALVDDVDRLVFSDADGSVPPDSLVAVVETLDSSEGNGPPADLTVGSRRHPEATIETHQTAVRRRLGDLFAWTARRLVEPPLYDYQCGAKALTSDTWRAVRGHLYEPGFGWDLELVAMSHATGRQVMEVPVTWADRPGSTVDPLSTVWELAWTLVHVRHRAKRLNESRLHGAIAARREEEVPLIDRPTGSLDD